MKTDRYQAVSFGLHDGSQYDFTASCLYETHDHEECMPYLWILHACVCVFKGRNAGVPERAAELALGAPSIWTICMICAPLKDKQQSLSNTRDETC